MWMKNKKKILIIFIILSICNMLFSLCNVKERGNVQVRNLVFEYSDDDYSWQSELTVQKKSYIKIGKNTWRKWEVKNKIITYELEIKGKQQ